MHIAKIQDFHPSPSHNQTNRMQYYRMVFYAFKPLCTMAVIEINGLNKFFGKFQALRDVTLKIEEGEVFGLLGLNGAGKTTLIRILMGLLKPTSGSVRVFGIDPSKEPLPIRKRASLLPQECQAYENLTAFENIVYYGLMQSVSPKEEIIDRAQYLIELIGLKGRENELTKKFSGGMKRKVLVARSVVGNPELLFLDEPTTGIDVLGARKVRNLIHRLSKEERKTIILTTHDLTEINLLCDRVGILVDGELKAIGSPDELEDQFRSANIEEIFAALVEGEVGGVDA